MQRLVLDKHVLLPYTTLPGAELICKMVEKYGISLIIKKDRSSKLGDYSHPIPIRPYHQITINGTLNKYAFIITFLHELAHLIIWVRHKRGVSPHGKEWKEEFSRIIIDVMTLGIFPADVSEALQNHARNVKSSSMSDLNLMRILKQYDAVSDEKLTVSDIVAGDFFEYKKKVFIRGEKVRTRIQCKCLTDKKTYVFHQLAPIEVCNVEN